MKEAKCIPQLKNLEGSYALCSCQGKEAIQKLETLDVLLSTEHFEGKNSVDRDQRTNLIVVLGNQYSHASQTHYLRSFL